MKAISQAAVKVLGSMDVYFEERTGNLARITAGQLDRKLYEEVNNALVAIGGKWSKKLKAHEFAEDPRDALDQVVLTGGFIDKKQEFGFFQTPADIAKLVIATLDLEDGMRLLEPSAGQGRLLIAAIDWAKHLKITALDVQPDNVALMRRDFGRYPDIRLLCTDFLICSPQIRDDVPPNGKTTAAIRPVAPIILDRGQPLFDRVVMNPPFARQLDIEHVTHALKFLRRGGRLVSVMSAGVMFRDNAKTKAFRDLGGHFEDLPDAAFASSGTNVRTVLFTIDKE